MHQILPDKLSSCEFHGGGPIREESPTESGVLYEKEGINAKSDYGVVSALFEQGCVPGRRRGTGALTTFASSAQLQLKLPSSVSVTG